jgi:methionyl-tRNA formyltransferase
MRIALFCATRRGYRFLEKLTALSPGEDLTVFTFREEAWEPPFLEDIRNLALSSGAQFYETRQLKESEVKAFWDSTSVDLLLTVNWRYIIPSRIYSTVGQGAYVFHDSLLPTYRGFSPTVWAMANGEDHTGVSLIEMGEGFDTGDMVAQQVVPIGLDDTIADVFERVTEAYLSVLEQNLDGLLKGTVKPVAQDHSLATFTCKRLPEDNEIDWKASSRKIYDLIRAVTSPYPGAFTTLNGKKLTIWSAKLLPDYRRYIGNIPGRIVEYKPGEGTVVLTGDDPLLIKQIQLEDGGIIDAAQILNKLSYTLGR